MIIETTWHRSEEKQKRFEWCAMIDGLQLKHENENPPYVIPWRMFHSILRQAMSMASANNGEITAGTHQSNPSPGSVGEWVLAQDFTLEPGALTPRHLSFLGPIFGRMGFFTRRIEGNSIKWVLTV